MAFRIATNVSSLNTQKWLQVATTGMSKSLERLSSGSKINKSADDAAGVSIALKLSIKAVSLDKAIDNGNQAVSMLQAAEGGVEQIANIVTRLKEIATQAASSNTDTAGLAKLNAERSKLEGEIDQIANTTKYGGTSLLNGGAVTLGTFGTSLSAGNGIDSVSVNGTLPGISVGANTFTLSTAAATGGFDVTLAGPGGNSQTLRVTTPSAGSTASLNFTAMGLSVQVNSSLTTINAANTFTATKAATTSLTYQLGDSSNANDQIAVTISSFLKADLGITGDFASQSNATTYLNNLDTVTDTLNTSRGTIGAAQNQIGFHVANVSTMSENMKAAASTIKDTDYAKEMADFTKFQVITQSGIAMLAQANQVPQMILSLLK
jgi:flagellin